jgi:hypothetical protein
MTAALHSSIERISPAAPGPGSPARPDAAPRIRAWAEEPPSNGQTEERRK